MTPDEATASDFPYFRLFARFKDKGFHRLPNYQHLTFLDRDRHYELNGHKVLQAHRCDPKLFNENGELLAKWKVPLRVRWKANTPTHLPGFSPGIRWIVDDEVRRAIEDLDAGRHVFIDLEVVNRTEPRREFSLLIVCQKHKHHLIHGPDTPDRIGEPVEIATVDGEGLNGFHLTKSGSPIISADLLRRVKHAIGPGLEFQPLVFAK